MKKLIFLFAFLLVGVAAAAPSVVSTTQTSATVEGLDCGSKYRFEIRKYAPDGSLSSSADFVDAQMENCPDTQPPSAPQNVTATGQTQTSISVSWNASTDDVGVTGYDLYRNGAKVDSTSATSYTFDGLSCGTSYTLAVEAHDAAAKRSAASAITASTAVCPPPSCPTGAYSAQYYGNMTLSGAPVLQRCETAINSDWGSGSPATSVPADRFSTRWTGTYSFSAGTYQFAATADDGIRVWIDGVPLIDSWKDQAATTYQAARILTAGEHVVKVEYYENGGGAVAKVSWQLNPPTPPPPPPPPSPTSCPTGEYSAQYYGNMTLSGTPVLQRCETAINYGWGSGSPATGVPADRFSTRWTGTHSFAAGTYQFTATADDGIRVWIDGVPLIDSWKDQGPTTYPASRILTAGEHVVKVEYYENGGGAVARVSWQVSQPPVPPPPPPPPPPSGEAALAVSTTGSDATCARGDLSRACATLNKAYSLAQCGDVVEVRQGSYGLQQLVETGLSACSNNVVFRPAVGAAVSVQQIEFGNGGLFSGNAADRVTIRDLQVRNAIFVWGDSENIDLINIDGGSIGIQGGWNIRVLGGDFGPCDSRGPSACRERMWITSDNRVSHGVTRNVLIEGATIHDYSITGAGDHWECMYTTGGENVVLRGNKFYNCAIYAIAVGPRDWSKYDPWLIENNWFGLACNTPNDQPVPGCGTARPSAIMLGGTSFEPGGDLVIRYNSFADVSTVNTEGNQGLSSKIKILGNILGSIDGSCLPNVTYAYNVIHDDTRCGVDSSLISGPMPYVNADARAAMNYHLAGPSVADGFVSGTAPYLDLATDYDQQPRRVPRTAGSDER